MYILSIHELGFGAVERNVGRRFNLFLNHSGDFGIGKALTNVLGEVQVSRDEQHAILLVGKTIIE